MEQLQELTPNPLRPLGPVIALQQLQVWVDFSILSDTSIYFTLCFLALVLNVTLNSPNPISDHAFACPFNFPFFNFAIFKSVFIIV